MKKQVSIELIAASQNAMTGDIIYTFKQTFPRLILAEINTHLIAGKNTASSRAIPTLTMLKDVLRDPFLPTRIGQYQKGMQAGKEITGWRRKWNELLWLWGRYPMVLIAWITFKLGAPKQFSNRLIEPWCWTEQLWTATDVENELMLRAHFMAEPHYEQLAIAKRALIHDIRAYFAGEAVENPERFETKCKTLWPGEWHLPFVDRMDALQLAFNTAEVEKVVWFTPNGLWFNDPDTNETKVLPGILTVSQAARAISAGRCAWVSYFMPGDQSKKMNSIAKALSTYHKLTSGTIRHLSPTMHVATPLPLSVRVANLCGWFMLRKEFDGESGGDKVVPSITPWMAKRLMARQEQNMSYNNLITCLGEDFVLELKGKTRQMEELEAAIV